MPIREVLDETIEQECGHCRSVHKVPYLQMSVGLALEGLADDMSVILPLCPSCGAQEFLFAFEGDDSFPGSYGHLHRLLVNIVYRRLIDEDVVKSSLSQKNLPQVADSEVLHKWFPNGFRLHRPVTEHMQSAPPSEFIS